MGGVPTQRGGGIHQAGALERSDAQEGQPPFGTVPSQGGASLAGCTAPCRLRSTAGVAAVHDGRADAPGGGSAPFSAVAAACVRLNRRYRRDRRMDYTRRREYPLPAQRAQRGEGGEDTP